MDYKLDPPEPTWAEQTAADESVDLSIEDIMDYIGRDMDEFEGILHEHEEQQLRDEYYEIRTFDLSDPNYGYDG